jgi:hypothetical protein
MDPVVACVSFIGRGSAPLFFRAFSAAAGSDEELQLQLAVFSALDAVDERVPERRIPPAGAGAGAPAPAAAPGGGAFLNLLLPVEDYKVFGYVTATSVKIIVVVKDVLLREDRVRELFVRLHAAYADAVASPFAPVGDAPLGAPAFAAAVDAVVAAHGGAIRYTGPVPF